MKMVTGALLILGAEQAFAHAYSMGFPHERFAQDVLTPASLVLGVLGAGFLVWGVLTEWKSPQDNHAEQSSPGAGRTGAE